MNKDDRKQFHKDVRAGNRAAHYDLTQWQPETKPEKKLHSKLTNVYEQAKGMKEHENPYWNKK